MATTERLSALDGTFLELEDADPSAHMHIGAIMTFAPAPGGRPDLEALCRQVDERTRELPRFRRRLARPDAGELTWQHWEDDPHFDVHRHVRRASLPAPGGWTELLDWAGDWYSRRLDRDRPLWEFTLLEGLEDGGWALVTKMHHCLVDGVGSVEAFMLILDAERDPPPRTAGPPAGPPAPSPGPLGLLRSGVQAGMRAASHPGDVLRHARAIAELVVKEELIAAPSTSINQPIGPRRHLQIVRADLGDVKAIKNTLGGTVNDVVLAAVTAGLRALLLARGDELPEAGIRAMVPMNVRGDSGGRAELGNRVSSMFVELPVTEADPSARYAIVSERMAAIKASPEALGADTLLRLADAVPPVLHQSVARTLFARRLFNVTVTNIPGPGIPLYALGSRLTTIWPLVPLAADHGLGIAIISYDGSLVFGLNADADTVPDVDVLAEAIGAALVELGRLAYAVVAASPGEEG